MGSLSYELSYMRFRIPGTTVTARIVEAVETTDSQYDVFDVGIEHEHGGIDSIVVGASAYSLKKAVANLNRTCDEKNAADAAAPASSAAAWHPASPPYRGFFFVFLPDVLVVIQHWHEINYAFPCQWYSCCR